MDPDPPPAVVDGSSAVVVVGLSAAVVVVFPGASVVDVAFAEVSTLVSALSDPPDEQPEATRASAKSAAAAALESEVICPVRFNS